MSIKNQKIHFTAQLCKETKKYLIYEKTHLGLELSVSAQLLTTHRATAGQTQGRAVFNVHMYCNVLEHKQFQKLKFQFTLNAGQFIVPLSCRQCNGGRRSGSRQGSSRSSSSRSNLGTTLLQQASSVRGVGTLRHGQ